MNKTSFLSKFRIPVVASPMFIVSQVDLVVESCKSGILGTFPALNNRTNEGLDQWLTEINEKLSHWEKETGKQAPPYGMNLIVHKTNPRLEADLKTAVKHKVPIIITSLGAVSELVDTVHSYGGMVFHDVINTRHAEKAIEAGVDGLICVCAGAGGHAGTLNPMPFISEVKSMFDGYVLAAGAISTGRDIASVLQMGADLAYMGTRFINTEEAIASPAYQQMIIDGGTADVVYTAAISGVNGNYLRQSLEAAGITKEMWGTKAKMDFSKLEVGKSEEKKAWKDIWSAGQGVATIKDRLPVDKLVNNLESELHSALQEQVERAKGYLVV